MRNEPFLEYLRLTNMNYKRFLFLCLFPLSSWGQTISWDEALRYTIAGSPELRSAENEYRARKEEEAAVIGNFLPKISASTSLSESRENENATYNASLNFSQNLFNGLSDSARYDEAKLRSEVSRWSLIALKASLSFQLKDAFSNLVYAQDFLALTKTILNRRESNFKLVSVRYENGRENKGSVLLAEAYYEQSKFDLVRAEDGLKIAEDALKSLMNKEHLGAIRVHGEIPLPLIKEEKETISELVLQTPSYQEAELQEKIAGESVKIARSSFYPTLDLTGSMGRTGESYFPERERWGVGLTLTIPLFDGFKDKNKLEASTFTKYAAENKKRHAFLRLIPEIGDARNQALQSDLKLSVDYKFQEASKTRAEIARARYNNGLISFEDWDIIENEFITRQKNYLTSRREKVQKYAGWEKILGRGVIP